MTREEWLEEAERYERKAQEAYEKDSEIIDQFYEVKARACRENADLAPLRDESKGETQ